MPVTQAVQVTLSRSAEQRYEPLIVEFGDQACALLDVHVLLLEELAAQLGVRAAAVLIYDSAAQALNYAAGLHFDPTVVAVFLRKIVEPHAGPVGDARTS